MANEGRKKQLGRGLSALLGDDQSAPVVDAESRRLTRIVPIEFVFPGRFQPRQIMNEDRINELAQSIRDKGILQPLLVRQNIDDPNSFEIIAGERRWRAAQVAQLHEVPVIVKDLTDQEALEIALVENLQRQDLSPLEEADGYKRLMDEFSHTQQELAEVMGKSRSHIANMLRLLGLPAPIKDMVNAGSLTSGHARALLNASDPVALADKIIRENLNVRQAERLAQGAPVPAKATRKAAAEKDADTLALERDLSDRLGLNVDIRTQGEGGKVTIAYASLEQLDGLIQRLSLEAEAVYTDDADDAFDSDYDDEEVLELEEADAIDPFPSAVDDDPVASWEAESSSKEFSPFDAIDDSLEDTSSLDAALDAPVDLSVDDQVHEVEPADLSDLDEVLLHADPVEEEEETIDTADLDAVLVSAEGRAVSDEPVAELDALRVEEEPVIDTRQAPHPAVSTIQALDNETDLDDSFDLDEEVFEPSIQSALDDDPVASWEAESSSIDLDALDDDLMDEQPAKPKPAMPGKPTFGGGIELEDD